MSELSKIEQLQKQLGEALDQLSAANRALDEARKQEPVKEHNRKYISGLACDSVTVFVPLGYKLYAAPIPAQVSKSPRITEQDDSFVSVVAQEIYCNGGPHESQIDVARRIIRFIQCNLPSRITEQDAREIAKSYFSFNKTKEFTENNFKCWLKAYGSALLNKLKGAKNAQ